MLKHKFKIRDLGNVKDILGIHIERKNDNGNIKITQKKYILNFLKKFGMQNCNPLNTPLDINIDIANIKTNVEYDDSEILDVPYRELVGNLISLANVTRPDIAFAANVLSRFCTTPKKIHWKMAKRILRYLKGTAEYSIKYVKEKDDLIGYVDSDWAGDTSDRRSCTGYVMFLSGGPVNWNSKKQKTVALSTMEAEYMALSEARKEIIYLRNLLNYMKVYEVLERPTTIYCDKQSRVM